MPKSKLSQLKKGDVFRFKGGKTEYLYTGKTKGRCSKFTYQRWDDISSYYETSNNKLIDFEFEF